MRYANTQLKRLIEKSYKKTKWWQEFRSEISMAILIIMLTFSFWFLFGEMKEILGQIGPLLNEAKQIHEISSTALGNIANLCSPSGIAKV